VVPRPKPTSISQPRHKPAAQASIELYWLPLGAGGWFVRLNGASTRPSTRAWSGGNRSISTTRRSPSIFRRDASSSRTPGRSLTPPAGRGAWSSTARWPAGGWPGFACSAMRCAAGATGSSTTPARPWPARSCWATTPPPRVGCWTWSAACPARSGVGTSLGRERCGTRTRWLPGCWPAAACRPTRSVLRLADGPRDGGPRGHGLDSRPQEPARTDGRGALHTGLARQQGTRCGRSRCSRNRSSNSVSTW